MTTSPDIAARGRETHAEVCAHDHVMRYRRCGVGRTLLVLDGADGADPLWPDLVDAMGARFRLVAPDVHPGAMTGRWLADFLEGLGIACVDVVATDACCVAALELALLYPERVTAIVLLADAEADDDLPLVDGSLVSGTPAAPVPLLVARRAPGTRVVLPLVARFLDGPSAG